MMLFLQEYIDIFWELATSDFVTLMKSLNDSCVPKAVLTPSLVTEHVAFLARRYDFLGGIGHIRFVHPHEIIE
jgi:hypothetical protein